MNVDEYKEKIRKTEELADQIRKYETDVSELAEKLEEEYKQMLTDVDSLNIVRIKKDVVDIYNKLLTNLISKRVKLELSGKRISISNAGFGLRGWRSYNYLPTKYMPNDAFKWYGFIFQHKDIILNILHKEDKKEIFKICCKYHNKFKDLERYKRMETKVGIKQFIIPQSSREYRGKTKYVIERFVTNTIRIEESNYGIWVKFDNEYRHNITIQSGMPIDELLELNEIMQDEEMATMIKKYIKQVQNQREWKVRLINQMRDELQPYLVMEEL